MFRDLLESQRDVYNLTLNQYRYGTLLESCAIEAGLKPQAFVTLHTDVLGRLVFSALGRRGEQAGGQSEEDRAQFMRMTVSMLDRSGDVAKHGSVLFDPSLSNSQKASRFSSSVVNEFGGPVPFALGAASLGANIAQAAKQAYDLKAKNQMEEDLNQIKVAVDEIDKNFGSKDPKELVGLVAREYRDIKKKQDELVAFFQVEDKNKGSQTEIQKAKNNLQALRGLFTTLEARAYAADQPNIDTALLFWLSSNFESLKILIDGNAGDAIELPENLIDGKAQNEISAIVQRISEACKPKGTAEPQLGDLEAILKKVVAERPDITQEQTMQLRTQLTQEYAEKSCLNLLDTFRRESVALRFVLQELLKQPVKK
jgi:hypothetical protein